MAKSPRVKKDTWFRSRRLQLEYPGDLSFADAMDEEGNIDDAKGIKILEDRERILESLVEKAKRDRLYIERR